ncbi:hypothetical protein Ocin01_10753 [Orchesella cincta]|uniref:BEN domain-containing protein n=1 Tax=Orchesella cincta TaxID=48709 RepID=A0A1D2MS37_ORCCI|nr:hypothetical protein Ocin01_10753 [Orchesella cincta]
MTFPCLVCGELPLVPEQPATAASSSSPFLPGGGVRGNNSGCSSANGNIAGNGNKKSATGGTTIRTLSKDVSDKIFQNLCRHLYVKTEPYWFIQNPGEQMPLCATCSAVVLEIYTLQTKVDQFQAMIKKQIWNLERVVADTEIASNWMATREEQEGEEAMWNSIPCPPLAIRIARERHHKFRQQVLQNFKSKVKLRQKMRAADPEGDEMSEIEPTFTVSLTEPVLDGGIRDPAQVHQYSQPPKRSRLDDPIRISSSPRANPSTSNPATTITVANPRHQSQQDTVTVTQSSISIQPSGTTVVATQMQTTQQFVDESEMSDDNNSQVYPDVQIVCTAGPVDYLKEEQEYSNSGDGEESGMLEQDGGYWNTTDENFEYEEETVIPEGEDAIWLAPGVALRKNFLSKIQAEQLKPSVFLRKLAFAVFGLTTIANSSGISGSNKPGAKPSLDRFKFEALREFTIETYGIREDLNELEDLNRKIRTICCDARKAIKRRNNRSNAAPRDSYKFETQVPSVTQPEQGTSSTSELFEIASTPEEASNDQQASSLLIEHAETLNQHQQGTFAEQL